jgi:hypothetical protein
VKKGVWTLNMKKVEIFKRDKWNMIHVEQRGREIEVIEISEQWGEDSRVFHSRVELHHWVNERFSPARFQGTEAERLHIIEQFHKL